MLANWPRSAGNLFRIGTLVIGAFCGIWPCPTSRICAKCRVSERLMPIVIYDKDRKDRPHHAQSSAGDERHRRRCSVRALRLRHTRHQQLSLVQLWRPTWRRSGSRSLIKPTVSTKPTPCSSRSACRRRGDGHADLSYIYSAVREIAPLPGPSQTSSVGLRSLGSSRLR